MHEGSNTQVFKKVKDCAKIISDRIDFKPKVALVLGSGLGGLVENADIFATIDYKDIPGFPVSTIEGHSGRFVFCHISGVPTVVMQGRIHYYEGYPMQDVVLPVRVMKLLGADTLFLTNASGAINKDFDPGDLMLIKDQISSFVPSPLVGPNIDELGVRFPDMGNIYSKRLQEIIRKSVSSMHIPLREGVYVQASGPAYESPQEVKMFRTLGADSVAMSTACEAVAAVHAGMEVCGISCISNKAADLIDEPLTHDEVQETAKIAVSKLSRIVLNCLPQMCGTVR